MSQQAAMQLLIVSAGGALTWFAATVVIWRRLPHRREHVRGTVAVLGGLAIAVATTVVVMLAIPAQGSAERQHAPTAIQ